MNRRELIAAGLAALALPLTVVSDAVASAAQAHDADALAQKVRRLVVLMREIDPMLVEQRRKTETSQKAEFKAELKRKLNHLRQEMERLFPGVTDYVLSKSSGE